jgi:hypothetical protein
VRERDPQHQRTVAIHERHERRLVAGAQALEQFGVGVGDQVAHSATFPERDIFFKSLYRIAGTGAARAITGSLPVGQAAACWVAVTAEGRFAYTGNATTGASTRCRASRTSAPAWPGSPRGEQVLRGGHYAGQTMTAVAASIILAAVVGGVIFVLLDSWQRREATPAPAAEPEPAPWRPAPPRPSWDTDDRPEPETPGSLWSGWARR